MSEPEWPMTNELMDQLMLARAAEDHLERAAPAPQHVDDAPGESNEAEAGAPSAGHGRGTPSYAASALSQAAA
jgi:hypothetical protein